ncbi:MAG: hypothetical protein ABWY25_03550 [Paenisporosarcina sp.]
MNEIEEALLSQMPTKVQFVKVIVTALVAFTATKLTEKAFDKKYVAMKMKLK